MRTLTEYMVGIGLDEAEEVRRRINSIMPYDKAFWVNGKGEELCHCTGYEVFIDGNWYQEYLDSNGEIHYL